MASFGVHPTYTPTTHNHNPPVNEHEINRFRIERGQCPKCGLQTHKLKSSLIRGKKLIPLTNTHVLSGRCLDCNPMQTTSPAAPVATAMATLWPLPLAASGGATPSAPPLLAPPSKAALVSVINSDEGDYVGELDANGLRCGSGKMTWKNGNRYKGEWKGNEMDGQGAYWYPNGNSYEGQWKANKMDGQGTYWYANGDRYEGEWRAGTRDGQGTQWYQDIIKYKGEWKADEKDGQGTYWYANDNRYELEWKAGIKDGQVADYLNHGDRYEGEWKANEKNGQGTYWYANGRAKIISYKRGKASGEGVIWSSDRLTAALLTDGKEVKEISLSSANLIAAGMGFSNVPK